MLEDQLFKTLFEAFPFGVYIVDIATYEVIYANRSFLAAHGDCINKTCYEAVYKEHVPCHACRIGQLLKSESSHYSLTFERFNEYNECWYQHYEKVLRWSDGRLVKYTVEVDISALKATQNQLAEAHAELALKNKELIEINRHDELTKAFNRSHLNHVLAEQVYNMQRYQNNFSVVLMDIDDFKKINDNYGHLVGDAVLVELTKLVTNNIRQTDCFGRWGGEEFMIIVPHTKTACDTKFFVEKLCKIIADHQFADIGHCTCSIGLAHCIPEDNMISIVKHADDALYFAKMYGKNQVITYNDYLYNY